MRPLPCVASTINPPSLRVCHESIMAELERVKVLPMMQRLAASQHLLEQTLLFHSLLVDSIDDINRRLPP
jgi:hypothetical protein